MVQKYSKSIEDDDVIENPAILGRFFQVPENKQLLTYWDRVDDRLDKIRRSLNISGIFRQLPLFQPPIDPRALIAAGGASGLQAPIPVPHYRYGALFDIAKEMTQMAISFAAQLLGALETGSAEEIAMQEVRLSLAAAVVDKRVKKNAISVAEEEMFQLELTKATYNAKLEEVVIKLEEAESAAPSQERLSEVQDSLKSDQESNAIELAESTAKRGTDPAPFSVENATDKRADELDQDSDNLKTIFEEELNLIASKHQAGLGGKISSIAFKVAASVSEGIVGALSTLPAVETGAVGPFPQAVVKVGPRNFSGIPASLVKGYNFAADIADIAESLAKEILDEKLRREELKKKRIEIQRDLKGVESQMIVSEYNLDTAKAQYELARKEDELLNETKAYLRSKFTNIELYEWLSKRLRALLKLSYGHAFSAAKMAERALQYELPTDETFISPSNFSDEKRGLLAAEMLMTDLNQMSLFHLKNNSRIQEIERKISLRNEYFKVADGDSLFEEASGGRFEFNLEEKLFDTDYPGHYFRIIKSVTLGIRTGSQVIDKNLILPRLTLTQTSNRVLTRPDIGAVESLLGEDSGDEDIDPNILRVDWRSLQMVTISRWEGDDDGTNDDRYLPFEGTGVVSSWTLDIGKNPGSRNVGQANMEAILSDPEADIIVTVKYKSKFDGGRFKDAVESKIEELLEEE